MKRWRINFWLYYFDFTILWSYIDWPFISLSLFHPNRKIAASRIVNNTYTSGFAMGGSDWIIHLYSSNTYLSIPVGGRIGMLIHRRPQTSTMYHTTIKQGRSAASMWGWRGGVVYIRGIKPDFHSFGASKMGWCFTYFWYQWDTLLNVWIKQQLTNR